jgi:transitional endoplasmic reticulum ATPase
MSEDNVRALREAIKISPDNLPLRMLLAEGLCGLGQFEEAEREYTVALAMEPGNEKLQAGLANAFYQQGKYSHALVIVEDLVKKSHPPARALLIYARLLLNDGKLEKARQKYREAIAGDPSLIDDGFAERLGSESVDVRPESSGQIPERVRIGAEREHGDDDDDDADAAEFFEENLEKAAISFAEIGGMDDVKEQIRMKIIHPLKNPEIFKAYGKKTGGGILMYGPPGCGKTHLARATAGEIKARFLAVGINDVLDMWLGNSERNLHELFEQARRNTPCVVFFDEVDALAASRSDMRHSGGRHIINQFLMELDGVKSSNEGVLILAATNAPWHLDSAFRRPGRFDRVIFVPPPDQSARAAILRILVKGKPIDNIDFQHIASKTDKFSGADLMAVVDIAVEKKLDHALKTGKSQPINTKDLEAAAKSVKPSTSEWFATARNYALYSNQGGAYDDIVKYLKL